MTVVILLGPPGAGKGTQASRIAERLGIPAISTGDIFRANMAEGTEIGKQAQAYMDRGEFVPDSVTNAMVKARLAAPDTAKGFLLDGYPRSVEQAHVLRDMLLDLGTSIDVVLEIQVDEDEVVGRMLKRAQPPRGLPPADGTRCHVLRGPGPARGRGRTRHHRRGDGAYLRDPGLGGEVDDASHRAQDRRAAPLDA